MSSFAFHQTFELPPFDGEQQVITSVPVPTNIHVKIKVVSLISESNKRDARYSSIVEEELIMIKDINESGDDLGTSNPHFTSCRLSHAGVYPIVVVDRNEIRIVRHKQNGVNGRMFCIVTINGDQIPEEWGWTEKFLVIEKKNKNTLE